MGKGHLSELTIEDLGSEGRGVARKDGKVYFVDSTIPGDIVDARVYKKKKGFGIAKPLNFHTYSENRVEAFCSHFGICGGCKWQYLDYESQLKYKWKIVNDAFKRIGHLEFPEPLPIIGSERTTHYRNKLEFTFSNKKWLTREEIDSEAEFERSGLGFHIPRMFDKVLDISECHLQPDPSNEIRNRVRELALERGISFFDIREQIGYLRNLIIRTSQTGETLVLLCVFAKNGVESEKETEDRIWLMNQLYSEGCIHSLHFLVNPKKNDSFHDLEAIHFAGETTISENLMGFGFNLGPKTFFQTNTEQAEKLYRSTLDLADLQAEEVLYDLYTGIGSIAICASQKVQKVVGIELVPESIVVAKENAALNNVENSSFFAADVKDLFKPELIEKEGQPDVLIVDPPRAISTNPRVSSVVQREQAR